MSKLSLSDKAGIITFGEIAKYIVTLLLGICLVRIFSKEVYGTYQQVFLIVWTLIVFMQIGLPSSIYYFIPRLPSNQRKIFIKQTVFSLLLLGIMASIATYLLSHSISINFRNPSLEGLLKLFGAYAIPTLLLSCFGPILICLDKHRRFVLYTILTSLLSTVVIFLFAFLQYRLFVIFSAILTLNFVICAVALWYINKLERFLSSSWDIKLFISQIKYALPLGLSRMIGILGRQLDKFMIALFFLAKRFAVYNVGAIEIPIIAMLTGSVDSVILPKIVEYYKNNEKKEIVKLWHEMIRKVSMIILPAFFYLFILAPCIITLLYTNRYAESVSIFRIYLLILPLRLARFTVLLQAIGKSRMILKGTVLALIFNVIFNYILIHAIGFTGPAWATSIKMLLLVTFYTWQAKRNLKLSFSELYPWKRITEAALFSAIAGICIYPILMFSFPKMITIAITGIVYFLIYLSLLFKRKLLNPDDIDLIKRWLKLKVLFAR